jgi:hypothetical protein
VIRCDIRQDAAVTAPFTPTLTLTLTASISEPSLSHSSPRDDHEYAESREFDLCHRFHALLNEEEDYPVEIEPRSASSLRACPTTLTDSMIQQLHDSLPDALKRTRERLGGRDGIPS